MARGAAAANQLATTNGVAQGDLAQAMPAYTSELQTGYMNPQEETAANTNEMGAAAQPFTAAKSEAANRASRTNNASDLTSQQDQLALEQGQTAGQTAGYLQQQKMGNQQQAANALMGQSNSMYGLGPGTLDAQANLVNASWDGAKLGAGILEAGMQGAGAGMAHT